MSIWRLTLLEISHRKLHFCLGLLSITVAVAAYITATILLRDNAQQDMQILADMQIQQKKEVSDNHTQRKIRLEKQRAQLQAEVLGLQTDLEKSFEIKRNELDGSLAARQKELENALSETQDRLRARLMEREKTVAEAGVALQDAMRKITKGLGFNILILPKDQDLNKFHLSGISTSIMPEALATKLANSKIVTINHLLPVITRRVKWSERDDLEVVLIGTRGEVPLAHRDPKKPLLDMVPKGTMIVGHEIGKKLNLKKDQAVTLLGQNFKITKIHGERGSLDDSSIWLNLAEVQELLKMQNVINAILALECNCATVDRVAEIRAEIADILPGTKIIERGSKALARAEARNKAKQQADEDLKRAHDSATITLNEQIKSAEQTHATQRAANDRILIEQEAQDKKTLDQKEQKNRKLLARQTVQDRDALKKESENASTLLANESASRKSLQEQNERFASILLPLAVAVVAIWIGLLAYGNARRRQSEIGILRAIGLRSGQILALFLGKAICLGLLGAMLGVATGLMLGLNWGGVSFAEAQTQKLIEQQHLLLAAVLAPVIAMLGSWLPAMLAARQDPAEVLQEE